MKSFSAQKASLIAAIILLLLVVFNVLVLAGIIPYRYVWDGNLDSNEEMWLMVSLSLILNIMMAFILFVRFAQIKRNRKNVLMSILTWLLFVFFVLNTLGNAMADNWLEKLVFAPLTFILSLWCSEQLFGSSTKLWRMKAVKCQTKLNALNDLNSFRPVSLGNEAA